MNIPVSTQIAPTSGGGASILLAVNNNIEQTKPLSSTSSNGNNGVSNVSATTIELLAATKSQQITNNLRCIITPPTQIISKTTNTNLTSTIIRNKPLITNSPSSNTQPQPPAIRSLKIQTLTPSASSNDYDQSSENENIQEKQTTSTVITATTNSIPPKIVNTQRIIRKPSSSTSASTTIGQLIANTPTLTSLTTASSPQINKIVNNNNNNQMSKKLTGTHVNQNKSQFISTTTLNVNKTTTTTALPSTIQLNSTNSLTNAISLASSSSSSSSSAASSSNPPSHQLSHSIQSHNNTITKCSSSSSASSSSPSSSSNGPPQTTKLILTNQNTNLINLIDKSSSSSSSPSQQTSKILLTTTPIQLTQTTQSTAPRFITTTTANTNTQPLNNLTIHQIALHHNHHHHPQIQSTHRTTPSPPPSNTPPPQPPQSSTTLSTIAMPINIKKNLINSKLNETLNTVTTASLTTSTTNNNYLGGGNSKIIIDTKQRLTNTNSSINFIKTTFNNLSKGTSFQPLNQSVSGGPIINSGVSSQLSEAQNAAKTAEEYLVNIIGKQTNNNSSSIPTSNLISQFQNPRFNINTNLTTINQQQIIASRSQSVVTPPPAPQVLNTNTTIQSPSSSPLKPNIIRKTKPMFDTIREPSVLNHAIMNVDQQASKEIKLPNELTQLMQQTSTSTLNQLIYENNTKNNHTPSKSLNDNENIYLELRPVINLKTNQQNDLIKINSNNIIINNTSSSSVNATAVNNNITSISNNINNATLLNQKKIVNIPKCGPPTIASLTPSPPPQHTTLNSIKQSSTTFTTLSQPIPLNIPQTTIIQNEIQQQQIINNLINTQSRKRRKQEFKKQDTQMTNTNIINIFNKKNNSQGGTTTTSIAGSNKYKLKTIKLFDEKQLLNEEDGCDYDGMVDDDLEYDDCIDNDEFDNDDVSPPPAKITRLNNIKKEKLVKINKMNKKVNNSFNDLLDDETVKVLSQEFSYQDKYGIRWIGKNVKPQIAITKFYKPTWIAKQNHFYHYSDVKLKEEPKSLSELLEEKERLAGLDEWKFHYVISQVKDLINYENDSLNVINEVENLLKTHCNISDLYEKIHDTIKANSQRHIYVTEQLNEAQCAIQSLFQHKEKFKEILNTAASSSGNLNNKTSSSYNNSNSKQVLSSSSSSSSYSCATTTNAASNLLAIKNSNSKNQLIKRTIRKKNLINNNLTNR